MVSDHMVNIFFQEWAPLFPVVHRPTVLKVYTDYVANPDSVKNNHDVAQLNLIFGIAALSAEVCFSNVSNAWKSADIDPVEQTNCR